MEKKARVLFIIALLSAPLLRAEDTLPVVSIRELDSKIVVGYSFTLAVVFHFPDHTYQTDNREFFYVEVTGLEGVSVTEVRYPAGEENHDTKVYRGDVTLEIDLLVPESATQGETELVVVAHYQLCNDAGVCFLPQRAEISVMCQVEPNHTQGLDHPHLHDERWKL